MKQLLIILSIIILTACGSRPAPTVGEFPYLSYKDGFIFLTKAAKEFDGRSHLPMSGVIIFPEDFRSYHPETKILTKCEGLPELDQVIETPESLPLVALLPPMKTPSSKAKCTLSVGPVLKGANTPTYLFPREQKFTLDFATAFSKSPAEEVQSKSSLKKLDIQPYEMLLKEDVKQAGISSLDLNGLKKSLKGFLNSEKSKISSKNQTEHGRNAFSKGLDDKMSDSLKVEAICSLGTSYSFSKQDGVAQNTKKHRFMKEECIAFVRKKHYNPKTKKEIWLNHNFSNWFTKASEYIERHNCPQGFDSFGTSGECAVF